MPLTPDVVQQVRSAVQPQRLLETAVALIEIPSPTCSAAAVADRLEQIARSDGFEVQRVEANWPDAPAVVVRHRTGQPGRTLQFDGHLDTVHLPFVPPRFENGILFGSGASDMKGGVAAALEAMRALRDTRLLHEGGVLLTAHDHHESPWGDGRQVDGLIDAGILGDGVLLPEYLCDLLPTVSRGLAVLEARFVRDGLPVHEVLGGMEAPSVIAAGADLVLRLRELDRQLQARPHASGTRASCFVGQIHGGEIFNQSPVELTVHGTRRWLAGTAAAEVQVEFEQLCREVADRHHVQAQPRWHFTKDAYELDASDPLVAAFQAAHECLAGRPLPLGPKPFVDDGNTYGARGGIPAITHGPNARGAHTLHEEVPLDELVRVAAQYALTAAAFCAASSGV